VRLGERRRSLDARIATPDDKRQFVRTLFATIADRYDLITVVLSYGRDRRWKERLVRLAGPVAGRRALDLATGTGDIAFSLSSGGAEVVGLDITRRMIELAKEKIDGRAGAPAFLVGDMTALPFRAAAFEVVTTGYGLRNVPDLERAIAEIGRVVAPGGLVLSLDFNRPPNRLVRAVYFQYLTIVGAALGWLLHRDADTYRYIPASLRRYPDARRVNAMFEARGFVDVQYHPVLGGLMAIHSARKPL
jgi:demethylmenaquinone methyltransferase/2-methoxy-6-polyprenyl-1,4-benzoquinol methylase